MNVAKCLRTAFIIEQLRWLLLECQINKYLHCFPHIHDTFDQSLTHFMPLVSFRTPWKHQNTREYQKVFWCFQGVLTLALVFSCEFCEIFKNTFFTEHLQTTASNGRPNLLVTRFPPHTQIDITTCERNSQCNDLTSLEALFFNNSVFGLQKDFFRVAALAGKAGKTYIL